MVGKTLIVKQENEINKIMKNMGKALEETIKLYVRNVRSRSGISQKRFL